ncbi:LysR family transcriptional regulator [Bradyrhizobium sp. 157]|uniref:LysR family transcriptional regulator n=1 Tax=Bradyrhizobium sp. 157 TaxID=2782631 RepID=UPI001FF8600B|nr:LysR family transcriptional regulator [Bradyrhizobium sp. 157]MCK1641671.1 LysR family transcriptional regulator [Bradyrhizobium sp. 157]
MDLRHARTFVAVAELGTVSRAALRLHIAQPALSRQITALEHELGLKLFDRIGRRLVLTGEGEQLLSDCRVLLNYASAIDERAQLLKRGDTGVLKVGASPQHIESVLSTFLHLYAQRYPNVQIKLIEAAGLCTMKMLERGEIHLGQNLAHIVDPNDQRLASLSLQHVDLLAACHPSVMLSKTRTIEISKLAPYPLLLLNSSFVVRKSFDAACRLANLKPNIFLESHTPHTLLALAEAGHGVAIIPSQLRIRHHKLRIVGVAYRGKPLREGMVILWNRRRPLPGYAKAYCEMLAKHVREIFPITRPSDPPFEAEHVPVSRKSP